MDLQMVDRLGSVADLRESDRQSPEDSTVSKNNRQANGKNRIFSLSDLLFAMTVMLSTTFVSPAMSASIHRVDRSVPSVEDLIENLTSSTRSIFRYMYDCQDGNECVIQNFRERRFADPTAQSVNIAISSLPLDVNHSELPEITHHNIIRDFYTKVDLYSRAFEHLTLDERHVDGEESFISEFNLINLHLNTMLHFIRRYMEEHVIEYPTSHVDLGFEQTTNKRAFSVRTLHVLQKFERFLLSFESAVIGLANFV